MFLFFIIFPAVSFLSVFEAAAVEDKRGVPGRHVLAHQETSSNMNIGSLCCQACDGQQLMIQIHLRLLETILPERVKFVRFSCFVATEQRRLSFFVQGNNQ